MKARDRGLTPDQADDYGYDVVDLRALRLNSVGSVYVPGFGNLRMTGHAMRQLGAEIGVNWTKHYGNMPAKDIQRDVQSHLKYRKDSSLKRIVARKHVVPETNAFGKVATEGILRGFVSSTYTEIRDARLFDRIRQTADPVKLEEQAIAVCSLKENASHFMLVDREPVDLLTAQPMGGSITSKPGDGAYFGVRIGNSEVGSRALTGDVYFVRYACVNGVIVGIEESRLLYRQHRGVSDKDLDKLIENMYQVLPERHKQIVENSHKMHQVIFENEDKAKKEIETFMSSRSKLESKAVIKAFEKEPICTAYGVMQAIARVAMATRRNRDRQFEIEELAGKYMKSILK